MPRKSIKEMKRKRKEKEMAEKIIKTLIMLLEDQYGVEIEYSVERKEDDSERI